MDRTGNRVPISGNIISVTRSTASGEYRSPPRHAVANANPARLCAPPNMTENTWSGRKGNTWGKKSPIAAPAVFLRPESMCHFAIDVSRTLASASVTTATICERYFNSISVIYSSFNENSYFLKIQIIIQFG